MQIKKQLPEHLYDELSFFEISSLIAFQIFQKEKCDYQVIEVGLGGRLDATNILDPILSIVVSLSVDHVEFLGSDLKGIAYEKMGIARPGRTVLWGASGEYMKLEDASEHFRTLLPEGAKLWDLSENARLDDHEFVMDGKALRFTDALCDAPHFIKRNFILSYRAFCELNGSKFGYNDLMQDTFSANNKAPVTLVGGAKKFI